MKVNKGDKFVIEVDDVFESGSDELYKIKGFNSLVFDKNGIDKLKPLTECLTELRREQEKADEVLAELEPCEREDTSKGLSIREFVNLFDAFELVGRVVQHVGSCVFVNNNFYVAEILTHNSITYCELKNVRGDKIGFDLDDDSRLDEFYLVPFMPKNYSDFVNYCSK